MLKKLFLTGWILSCCTLFTFAQIQELGTPVSFTKSNLLNSNDIPQIVMPTETLDIPKLLAEDDQDLQENQPLRFAHRFDVDYNLKNSGKWEMLPNGDRIWRLNIWSPGAVNINLAYSDFFMPKGAKLYVYNADKSQIIGAFTSKNNQAHRQFTTRLIHDDKVTIEYFEPKDVRDMGALAIATIAHGYRHLDGRTAAEKAGDCQVNITCPEGALWGDQKKGVARILMDNAFLCSGTLIANTNDDCRLLFSTANHCVMAAGHDAATPNALVPLYTFYWNYECGCDVADGDCPDSQETTAGATVIVSSGGSGQGVGGLENEFGDFALLELTESPVAAGYDVYFNGWDRSGSDENYLPQLLTGIHHPAGDQKKISTDLDGLNNVGLPTSIEDGQYWQLFWEATQSGHAVTEGGSSGSPLFDSETQLVIGQLFGGSSLNCDDPALDRAVYGGFFYSFSNGDNPSAAALANVRTLAPHLDPAETGQLQMPGRYPCNVPPPLPFVAFTSTLTNAIEASTTDTPDDCLDYTDYTIGIKVSSLPDMPVPVTININDNSTSSTDYQLINNTLSLVDNSIYDITLRVFNDFEAEGLEDATITYTIDEAYTGNAIIGALNQTHTLNITDNDPAPEHAGSTMTTILTDDFENQTTSEATWSVDFGDLHHWRAGLTNTATSDAGMTNGCAFVSTTSLTQYLYVQAPGDETIMSTEIDATGISSMVLNFEWTSGGEGDATPYDFGSAVYSVDGGTTFVPIPGAEVLKLSNSTAVVASYALPAILDNTVFRLGFKWQHDENSGDMTPIAIDNVSLVGVQVGAANVTTVTSTTTTEAYLGPNSTVHFYNSADGTIMATIKNNENYDFGCTTVEIDRAGTGAETFWGTGSELTSKTFKVVPENPSEEKSINISLYYTNSEIAGWEGANTGGEDNSALKVIQGDQVISAEDGSNITAVSPTITTFNTSNSVFTATINTPSGTTYGYTLGQAESSGSSLAVNFIDFKAGTQEEAIVLDWSTSLEVNNQGFEVLRSTNPLNGFGQIGYRAGNGTTNKTQVYQYVDTKAKPGQRYYYQLRQIDADGHSKLSAVVSAQLNSILDVAIRPNPVSTDLFVDLVAKRDVAGILRVVNLLGQEIYRQNIEPTTELYTTINTTNFTNGVYLLQVIVNGEVYETQKFIKD